MNKPILLLYPPFEGKNYLKKRAPFPIGPLYLAAYLDKKGIPAVVKDFSYPPFKRHTRRPEQLKTGQSSYYRWGYGDDLIRRWLLRNLRSYSPMVGVSSLMSSNWTGAYRLINIIKSLIIKKTVIVGGPHATAFPDHVFKHSKADYVCLGEGEEALHNFVTGFPHEAIIGRNDKIKKSRTSFVEDMDSLPFPDRDLLMDDRDTRELYVTFSRACPHRCSFCGSHIIQGRIWRPKSYRRVIEEIKFYYEKWGVRNFVIEDDNPCPKGVGQIHFKKILLGIIKLQETVKQKMRFNVSHGIPVYATADDEMCELLWKAGFKFMSFPVESTNRAVLKDMNKPSVTGTWIRATDNWVKISGKPVPVQIIIGYPFVQTIETMLQTMIDIHRRGLLIWASHFRLNKGTELYDRCLEAGYIDKTYDPINTQAFYIETERFKKKDLQELMQISRGFNYAIEQKFNLFSEKKIKAKAFHSFSDKPYGKTDMVAQGSFAFRRNQNIAASILLTMSGKYKGGRPFVTVGKDSTSLIYKGIRKSRVYDILYTLLTGKEASIKRFIRRK